MCAPEPCSLRRRWFFLSSKTTFANKQTKEAATRTRKTRPYPIRGAASSLWREPNPRIRSALSARTFAHSAGTLSGWGRKPPRAADHLSVLPAFCPFVAQGLVRGQGAPRRPSSLASAPSPLQTTPLALSVISSSPFRQIRAFAG